MNSAGFWILLLAVNGMCLFKGGIKEDLETNGSSRKLLQKIEFVHPDCGWITQITSAPYVSSIQFRNPVKPVYWHQCGGVQLTSKAVLTTASCVRPFRNEASENFNNYTGELMGMMYVALSPQCRHQAGRSRIQLTRYYIHPQYQFDVDSQFQNNIAIVELEREDQSIPPYKDGLYVSYSNRNDPNFPSWEEILASNLTAFGYGRKNYTEGMALTTEPYFTQMLPLDQELLNFLDEEECDEILEDYNLTQYDLSDAVCGTMISGDLCQGDGGTPAMYKEPGGRDAVVGLFAFSTPKQCGDYQGEPMLFTNVTRFEKWISQVLDQINL